MKVFKRTLVLALPVVMMGTLVSTSCRTSEEAPLPLDCLPHTKAGQIIKKAIEFAGGWETWESVRSIEYKKMTILYHQDGTIRRKFVQKHQYQLQPELRVRIEWEEDDKRTVLLNSGYYAWKLENGQLVATRQDSNQARNSTFGSHYVFCMPFKLTDPGATLTYTGQQDLSNGTRADRVQVTYDPGIGDAGGLHTWTYYFGVQDGRLSANLLQYDNAKFSFTEYLDYKQIDGMNLPTRRYGYQSNAKGEKVSQTSEISYEEIRLNVPFSEDLFSFRNLEYK